MSSTLPGVHLARRKKARNHHRYQSNVPKSSTWASDRYAFYSPSGSTACASFLDENTLRAKRSLEEKLWSMKPSSKRGWGTTFGRENRATTTAEPLPTKSRRESTTCKSGDVFRSTTLSSLVGLERDVCSICLDVFQLHQSVIHLPCLHIYHAECLRPWLNAHSHCPYCRAPV